MHGQRTVPNIWFITNTSKYFFHYSGTNPLSFLCLHLLTPCIADLWQISYFQPLSIYITIPLTYKFNEHCEIMHFWITSTFIENPQDVSHFLTLYIFYSSLHFTLYFFPLHFTFSIYIYTFTLHSLYIFYSFYRNSVSYSL